MTTNNQHHRAILQDIAHRTMIERGLLPDFSAAALTELDRVWCIYSIRATNKTMHPKTSQYN